MDLVADMLFENLGELHGSGFAVARLRPPMRRRFGRAQLAVFGRLAYNADRLLHRHLDYPAWLRRQTGNFDLFHIIDHSYAQLANGLPAGRTIVTCHDLDAFRCLVEPRRDRRPAWFRALARRTLRGLQRAALVVCPSHSVWEELIHFGLVPAERLRVVRNGVHPSCRPQPDPTADGALSQLLEPLGCGGFLLHVGLPVPRKRLDVLLRVFAVVRRQFPALRLVRAGGPLPAPLRQLALELGVLDAIVELPFVDRRVLAAVYRRAALLLQTSEAEGFGLPVIEAMACGCPVVASDLPVLREVGAPAAVFCPLGDHMGWAKTVADLLRERRDATAAWERLRSQALAHSQRFRWAEAAHQMSNLYEEVLKPFGG